MLWDKTLISSQKVAGKWMLSPQLVVFWLGSLFLTHFHIPIFCDIFLEQAHVRLKSTPNPSHEIHFLVENVFLMGYHNPK